MSFTFLHGIPPLAVYAVIALLVGVESIGVPLPGETAVIAGALLSSRPELHISPLWVGLAAFVGAVGGDSIGYAIGRRYGPPLLDRMSRRFPRHVSHDRIAYAQHLFSRYGAGTVFFGRFVALLRMFAGPLAGTLRLTYPHFLLANAAGAACWAGGLVAAVHFAGAAADRYLADASWVLLVVVVVVGLVVGRVAARSFDHRVAAYAAPQRSAAGPTSGDREGDAADRDPHAGE